MDRLSYIYLTNPEWAMCIADFLEANPEFVKYVPIVAIDFTKNEKMDSIKTSVLYYICIAGVRHEYGYNLWDHVKTLKTEEEVINSAKISPKKKEYLKEAICLPNDITLEYVKTNKIKGIGAGGVAWITRMFSDKLEKNLVVRTSASKLFIN